MFEDAKQMLQMDVSLFDGGIDEATATFKVWAGEHAKGKVDRDTLETRKRSIIRKSGSKKSGEAAPAKARPKRSLKRPAAAISEDVPPMSEKGDAGKVDDAEPDEEEDEDDEDDED
eukprot:5976021-Alexandrium_andersonii.AAC.1